MRPFKYTQAGATHNAIAASAEGSSKYVAGGTNLLDLMKMEIEMPGQLIDINRLPHGTIDVISDGSVHVGALVRNSDLAYHPLLSGRYPVLSEALLSGASPQLRNMATVGGNLMQRTRCPYFYDRAFACNKRNPSSGCSAIPGFNRGHAVLGGSDKCIATHPSDMCVALAALGAMVHVLGPSGDRVIPMEEFHKMPGDTPEVETALLPGELITGVRIPDLPFAKRSHYLKVRDRASFEFALASAAVALDVQGGVIQSARIALGGVGTKPWRSPAAEIMLIGAPVSPLSFRKAAEVAMKDARPYTYNSFKIELARRTLARALETVGGMA